jgi:hypothetical protein
MFQQLINAQLHEQLGFCHIWLLFFCRQNRTVQPQHICDVPQIAVKSVKRKNGLNCVLIAVCM